MRPVNYLSDMASRLNQDPKTLAVIDRAMVEAGLRRKGSGRAIPWPTLREDLMFMLAVMGRRSVASAVEDAKQWAELPCLSGQGPFFEPRQMRSFLDCLEDLCGAIASPDAADQDLSDRLLVELDFGRGHATIAFRNEVQDHLLFRRPGPWVGSQARLKAEIDCGFLVHLARQPREEDGES